MYICALFTIRVRTLCNWICKTQHIHRFFKFKLLIKPNVHSGQVSSTYVTISKIVQLVRTSMHVLKNVDFLNYKLMHANKKIMQ